ncbi:TetR/AcrR family transcriptional regulator [Amycolatopsis benzoatilytica]|uniref:TetR/AcrR family transcriptional regulator n=1 Tax=Amycolatopsis benzoatilytica TaxID=346045 RepID=UPI000364AA19|nr:TetR family transcriptional regulator [Amycolatopsis benzoatilytica]
MRANGRTFTESGRRAQIVSAAIETIAEVGYQQASFAKIAKRAGLSSTGMISYHFAGKDDLVCAVSEEIVATATAFMQERIGAAEGRPARLRAYIESNMDVVAAHPAHLRALLGIIAAAQGAVGGLQVDTSVLSARIERLEAELRDGQAAGDFGEFDPSVMALAITGAIDALVASRTGASAEVLARSGAELADLFLRATAT